MDAKDIISSVYGLAVSADIFKILYLFVVVLVAMTLLKNPIIFRELLFFIGRLVSRVLDVVFLDVRSGKRTAEVYLLERKIADLRRDMDQINAVGAQVPAAHVDAIVERVKALAADSAAIRGIVLDAAEGLIEDKVRQAIPDHEELDSKFTKLDKLKSRMRAEKELESTIDSQLESSQRLKAIMINLFIAANIAIMSAYITGIIKLLDEHAIYSVLGLYVSLAAFIVYIYRSSNARISVAISIKEDIKKAYDAFELLENFSQKGKMDQNSLELFKHILINRAEREKNIDHPYEMIFRGVSNSTIQFKGGRVSLQKAAEKS